MVLMEDDKAGAGSSKTVENHEIVECTICGYHYPKTKKCPQCSIKEEA
jgi:rubrerythrin